MNVAAVRIEPEPAVAPLANPTFAGHRTARRAVELLIEQDERYRCPTRAERLALLIGFAKLGQTLNGAAFDAVRLDRPVDLLDPDAIVSNIDAITICEIKSTNQKKIGLDLKGYFFNITAAEQITAQSLGSRYRFVFVNTVTGEHQELSFGEIMGRARGLYPAWHIRF